MFISNKQSIMIYKWVVHGEFDRNECLPAYTFYIIKPLEKSSEPNIYVSTCVVCFTEFTHFPTNRWLRLIRPQNTTGKHHNERPLTYKDNPLYFFSLCTLPVCKQLIDF